MKRTSTAATLAVVGSLTVLAPVSSHAVPATTQPTSATRVWAAFQDAPAWRPPQDTVQFYVASPVITQQMTGRTVSFSIVSTPALDCSSLGAGAAGANSWTNVELTVTSCTPTAATGTVKLTKAMIGSRIEVGGWAQVPGNTASVTGSWTFGRTTTRDTAVATRPAPTVPATDRELLGTWNGQQVFLETTGSTSKVVVGSTSHAVAPGKVLHASIEHGDTVYVWTQDSNAIHLWSLDLATRHVTTTAFAQEADGPEPFVGPAGIEVPVLGKTGYFNVYSFDGVLRAHWEQYNSGWRRVGWTDDAFVTMEGGLGSAVLVLYPMDGRPAVRAGGFSATDVVIDGHWVSATLSVLDANRNLVYQRISMSSDGYR